MAVSRREFCTGLAGGVFAKKVGDDVLVFRPDASKMPVKATGSTESRTFASRFADIINVKDYGAQGDGVTDDTEAIRSAYAFAASLGGGNLFFPHGKYLITEPLDFYRPSKDPDHPGESIFWYATHYVPISLSGESATSSIIIAGFSDPSRAVVESIPSAAVLEDSDGRSAPLNVYNLGFVYPNDSDENTAPGFVWVYGHGNSYLENVNFLGGRNVHLKSLGAQNVRLGNVTSWYGGHAWSYKDTPGVSGGVGRVLVDEEYKALITASSAVFSVDDVGKKITTGGQNGTLQFTIASVTSSTVAIAAEPGINPETYTYNFNWILFESARATIAANSTSLTANCSCFSSSDVGREIYIQNGMQDANGKGVFRTKITGFTNASTVTISPAPSIAITEEFFAQAAVEFFSNEGVTGEDSSDVKAAMLHIEHYAGTGLVAKNCNSYGIINSKIHGETFTARYGDWQHSSTPSLFYAAVPVQNLQSCCGAWLDNFAGDINCDFDTVCASNGPLVCVSRQKGAAAFRDTHARILPNQLFIAEQSYSGKGAISVDGFYSWSSHRVPSDLVSGDDITFSGVMTAAYGEEVYAAAADDPFFSIGDARQFFGNSAWTEKDGSIKFSGDALFSGNVAVRKQNPTIDLTNTGLAAAKNWQINLDYGNFYIKDITGNKNRLCIHMSTGNVFPPANNSQSLGQSGGLWKDVYAGNDVIQTSDARLKTSIAAIDERLMQAWGKVSFKIFQMLDAVESKGGSLARLHVGVIAQEVQEAFASEGLDASRYGLFCYDEWEADPDREAGNAYAIRYAEALALECAYQRWLGEKRDAEIETLKARVAALEAR